MLPSQSKQGKANKIQPNECDWAMAITEKYNWNHFIEAEDFMYSLWMWKNLIPALLSFAQFTESPFLQLETSGTNKRFIVNTSALTIFERSKRLDSVTFILGIEKNFLNKSRFEFWEGILHQSLSGFILVFW